MRIFDKILIGIDGSGDSNRAVEKGAEIGKRFESKVIVFHSIEHHLLPKVIPLTVPLGGVLQYTIPAVDRKEVIAEYKKAGQKLLEQAKDVMEKNLVACETRLVEDVSPKKYILDVVDKEGFDLVILGCKGHHSKLKEIFMGSVPKKVLNEADCDVLIVR